MLPAQANQSLMNGFLVLQEVISAGSPIGSRDVARRLEMEHSRINRLLKTLVAIGMLRQDRGSKYSPGPRIHVISALSLHASGLITEALPVLEPIHRIGATVALGTLWRHTVVYLLHAHPDQDLSRSVGVHESLPENRSIIGRVLGPGAPACAWEDRPERGQRAWGARIGEHGAAAIAVVLPLDHPRADPPEAMLRLALEAAASIDAGVARHPGTVSAADPERPGRSSASKGDEAGGGKPSRRRRQDASSVPGTGTDPGTRETRRSPEFAAAGIAEEQGSAPARHDFHPDSPGVPVNALRDPPESNAGAFDPHHEYLVCLDSDGCVFDTMTLKHRTCFLPAFISRFGLAEIEALAGETWCHVSLRSRHRGCNRFIALLTALDLLAERPEVVARHVVIPRLPGLRRWIEGGSRLCADALERAAAATEDPDLVRALAWSREIDRNVARIVRGRIVPFAGVREVLRSLHDRADILVMSQGPRETIERDWHGQGLGTVPRRIVGQETGTKRECVASFVPGRYAPERTLVIGDSPGDLDAARAYGTPFFPIVPGDEEASWSALARDGLVRFLEGRFRGSYGDALADRFEAGLLTAPPWR